MKRLLLVVLLLIVAGGVVVGYRLANRGGADDSAPAIDAEAIERHNHAVGLMGMYDYGAATDAFQALVDQHPDWYDARVNLAVATLNRQNTEANDEQRALDMLLAVIAEQPDHLRAHYCAGLLLYRAGDPAAVEHLGRVAEADPDDAFAAYWYASALEQAGERDGAIELYREVIRLDPYLSSAYYRLSQLLRGTEEAEQFAQAFQRLENNPRAERASFLYTKMGRKAEALAVDLPHRPPKASAPPTPRPEGPLFEDATPLVAAPPAGGWIAPGERAVSITAAPIDDDTLLDLYIASSGAESSSTLVLLGEADGSVRLDPDHPLAGIADVNAALWGDIDNDGLTDVYLCRRGANQLLRRTDQGGWEDITGSSGTANGDLDTIDGAMFDADHDGDLDIFCVNADGPDELLNNNLDGTFRPLAEEHGLAGSSRASKQIVVCDLDVDRDADIIVINEQPPHDVYLNDRLWNYTAAPDLADFVAAHIVAVVAADLDADGEPELHAVGPASPDTALAVHEWKRGADGAWQNVNQVALPFDADCTHIQLHVADFAGSGQRELLVSTSCGWRVVGRSDEVENADLRGAGLALTRPAEGPTLVAVDAAGVPHIHRAGPGRHPFLGLQLTGNDSNVDSMRSNLSAIGVSVAVRVDSMWTLLDTHRHASGPGQSLQPLALGLAGFDHVDFISLVWPDGVLQTEVHGISPSMDVPERDLAAGRVAVIEEIQRQKSSCPVLFAWNGSRYEFVSDILGVGGMGFAVAPGEYAPPRPWESFLLPDGALAPRDAGFEIKIGEPMEEACYLDAAALVAYDLPPGWSMTLDERFAVLGPEPSGAPRFYRGSRVASRVVNGHGENVTADVAVADLRAAEVPPLDRRFLGRLREDHVLTLTFEQPIEVPDSRAGDPIGGGGVGGGPMLIADGWIEYPYSQTMFAAWQAGAEYRAPTIEAHGSDGEWQVVVEQFGYPAGMPRQMSLPLEGLPAGTTQLRITTNQEIYWDRLAVTWWEPCADVVRTVLPLDVADLRETGFAQRPRLAQRCPYYDYDRRIPLWDSRHQRGLYTAFGPVDELVSQADDALAIFGPGEEVHLRFGAGIDPPPPGWTRRYVLETTGWCKDMDLYTQHGETLAPIPHRGPDTTARDALHERYNTRHRAGR